MVEYDIIARLPMEWRAFFRELGSSIERGNIWFTEETYSQYGSRPDWHKLFSSLTKHDPCIEDGKVAFKPRFILLPAKLQEDLVKFLHDQSFIIPDIYLRDFVLGVISFTEADSSMYQQLTLLFQETKYPVSLLSDAIRKSSEVGESSQGALDSQKADIILPGTQNTDTVIILDYSHDEAIQEPAYKRIKLEEDKQASPVVSNSDVVAMETVEREDDKIEGREEDTCLEPVEIGGTVWKIKEIWQNCITDSEIEGLNEVSKLSVKEVKRFCKIMDFDSMSDDSIELVCQHLCQVSASLSYSSVVCILTFVLGHRLINLSQKASRKLSGAVTLVAQKFQKQTVDSILLPAMLQQELSSIQSEILCRTVKECLSATTKGYFIQKLMQNSFALNENKIPVLQTVIESNCDMTRDKWTGFLNCLNEASLPLAKNLKFGKLLLVLVNKHNKLFDIEFKNKFEIILDKHNTFLKKSVQTALNKIKI